MIKQTPEQQNKIKNYAKEVDVNLLKWLERSISPEMRMKAIRRVIEDYRRNDSMKIYNVKCRVYQRPYIKVIAATSEQKVREFLEKDPVEIEDIIELDIKTAQEIHEYILED